MNEEKLQSDATRGKRAQELKDDPILSEAFTSLHDTYIKAWAATHPAESVAREHYYRAVQILGDVRTHLVTMAADGRVAQKQIDLLGGVNRL